MNSVQLRIIGSSLIILLATSCAVHKPVPGSDCQTFKNLFFKVYPRMDTFVQALRDAKYQVLFDTAMRDDNVDAVIIAVKNGQPLIQARRSLSYRNLKSIDCYAYDPKRDNRLNNFLAQTKTCLTIHRKRKLLEAIGFSRDKWLKDSLGNDGYRKKIQKDIKYRFPEILRSESDVLYFFGKPSLIEYIRDRIRVFYYITDGSYIAPSVSQVDSDNYMFVFITNKREVQKYTSD